MRSQTLAALAVAGLLAVAACGGATTPSSTTGGTSPAAPSAAAPSAAAPSAAGQSAAPSAGGQSAGTGTSVEIKGFAFNPPQVTAKVGDTITWTNDDSTAHTVTWDDNSVDSGNLAQGATFQHKFDAAGTFAYHCKIHPNMKGTITVS